MYRRVTDEDIAVSADAVAEAAAVGSCKYRAVAGFIVRVPLGRQRCHIGLVQDGDAPPSGSDARNALLAIAAENLHHCCWACNGDIAVLANDAASEFRHVFAV